MNFSVQFRKVNHVVQQEGLDRVFASLADATRRGILVRLGEGPASIGELAEPTGMTLTGMKKHVQVLEDAGLVVTEKVGRSRQCRLAPAPLDDAMEWISFYQRLWARRLDGLDAYFTLRRGAADQERSAIAADQERSAIAADQERGAADRTEKEQGT
ncbi:metalloregulator ArsR/SmtB family transcription factor [Actinoplanes sp. Pm04-4]|uniref:Metalloregulator ArsR/SmtB family transcription factor n=1 Tax=Paractinoplanes pyxinae TaxID=2997416 RepID=A0ABT4B0X4_9ACTN|nr:metalloregulator ArsR/SmtB family transcription factor [Actinoplanes pyxinae]MCY1140126.1 metalloregulator ArsR/SmtB family transcription factor [Actinoplanes pyxinae]